MSLSFVSFCVREAGVPEASRFVRVAPLRLCRSRRDTQNAEHGSGSLDAVRDRLRAEVGDDVYSSWFARMELDGSEGETVKLSVPTRFLKSWIQSHYAERVLACWQAEQPDFSRIELTVRSAVIRTLPPKLKPLEVPASPRDVRESKVNGSDARSPIGPISAVHDALGGSPLDPRLTFETFVVGRSNTLAHAAAKQVAQGRRGDMVMFNPLYIHAGVGLGKTHLLQSLAWAGNTSAERKVLYLTAEKFMYGFVAALRAQNALAFKDALRTIDVLVIDDLQFLQGKSTQAEFCHTPQRAHRCRPAGGDRCRPAAGRSGEPGRAGALASGGRARGRDGSARGRVAP
jgi:chromosomal replication initiator protein